MEIHLSVRSLVEFLLREGDITEGDGKVSSPAVMQRGAALHKKIQNAKDETYLAEESLTHTVTFEKFTLVITGRADGIGFGDLPYVEEIKGRMEEKLSLQAPVGVHLAQAKCYAYIYALQNAIDSIGIKMTYGAMLGRDIRSFEEVYAFSDLETWFQDLMHKFERWGTFMAAHEAARNASIKDLKFPYPYRKGQKDVAASVYVSIKAQEDLFIQAPTGIGKTLAVLFPAVHALGSGLATKIFYLTARTITRTVAESTVRLLADAGLKAQSITLTAKEKICPLEKTVCSPDTCPRAKGHFDRVNDALFKAVSENAVLDREAVEDISAAYRVCPFELALDATLFADIVICDYNYVFDPNVRLKRFFSEGRKKKEHVFLVDEAHNLLERGKEMYSSMLSVQALEKGQASVPKGERKIRRRTGKLLKALKALEGNGGLKVHLDVPAVYEAAESLMSALQSYLEKGEGDEDMAELFFLVRDFVRVYEERTAGFVVYTSGAGEDFFLKLFCTDPSEKLSACRAYAASTIYFSATLLPVNYYKRLLDGRCEARAIYIPSPFHPENTQVLVSRDTGTLYRKRGEDMYKKMAKEILTLVEGKAGNYMAFFPSYRMLEAVSGYLLSEAKHLPELSVLQQKSAMTEKDRENFLERFKERAPGSLLGLAVLGGIFSEGIDLYGESLIGCAVLGTGLPGVTPERNLLRDVYDSEGLDGFDYAYRYPGIGKVLQAAGRVIRTENDKGVILLMDERFLLRAYGDLFPPEWEKRQVTDCNSLHSQITEFWQNVQSQSLEKT